MIILIFLFGIGVVIVVFIFIIYNKFIINRLVIIKVMWISRIFFKINFK